MGKTKRFITVFLAVFCVGMMLIGMKLAIESGLMKRYPDAKQLSAAEERFRPAYQQLTSKEKSIYTAIYRGICNHEEKIDLPFEVSGETYSKIYCLLEKQEGELFYADSNYYTAEKVREAHIIYRTDEAEAEKMKLLFEAEIQNALVGVTLAAGEYEAALRIHDYLIRRCSYDASENSGFASTAYGCLVEKKANCEGYAKAFQLLMRRAGADCALVTGVTDKGENHAWNQLKAGGEWYNLDVTWDDSDVNGDVRRTFFMCNDEQFGKTHISDGSGFKPYRCESLENSFYSKSGLYADSEERADEILAREIRAGNKKIEIRFAEKKLYDNFKRRYIDEHEIFSAVAENAWVYDPSTAISVQEEPEYCCIIIQMT